MSGRPVDLPALVEAVRALAAEAGHTPAPDGDAVLWAGLGGWLEAAGIPWRDGDDRSDAPGGCAPPWWPCLRVALLGAGDRS